LKGASSSVAVDRKWGWPIFCRQCGSRFPQIDFPYRCPECGGLYELAAEAITYPACDQQGGDLGISRFRDGLPLPPRAAFISLGEGNTPLVPSMVDGRRVYFKCEYLNPTGSFKDRGSAALVSALVAAGVHEAIEDSSGNAGASFAAYAARAGIRARIYVPEYAAGPKRLQMASHGAEVIPVPGPRAAAAQAVQREAQEGKVYASHAHLPHVLAGMATLAFELQEQLGHVPGTVIVPVGQGTLFLGLHAGFRAMLEAGAIENMPQFVAAQAKACAPIWAVWASGAAGLAMVREGETVAEGVRIAQPLRGDAILAILDAEAGRVIAVEEAEIFRGRTRLGRAGFFVEPTSAIVWPALKAVLRECAEPIAVILTGSGLKDPGQLPA
jgi:threonine synthase